MRRSRRGIEVRTMLLSAGVVLATAAAITATALASGGYSLHLTVPSNVDKGKTFKVTAAGAASNKAHLAVFLASAKCKSTAKAEAAAGVKIVNANVVHTYSSTKTETASVRGTRYACAYLSSLPPAKLTYAKASKRYTVVAPQPPKVTLVITPGNLPCTATYFNVTAADSAGLTNLHFSDGAGFVTDTPEFGATSDNRLYAGSASNGSFTASITATDKLGLQTTVSKGYAAPSCP